MVDMATNSEFRFWNLDKSSMNKAVKLGVWLLQDFFYLDFCVICSIDKFGCEKTISKIQLLHFCPFKRNLASNQKVGNFSMNLIFAGFVLEILKKLDHVMAPKFQNNFL